MKKVNFKNDFKILRDNKDLVYLNSAASTLKLDIVVDEISKQYKNNINTINKSFNFKNIDNNDLFDNSLKIISNHINANEEELIPTWGTTDILNKLSYSIINSLNDNDEIILGRLEHSANLLPWINAIKNSGKKINIKWYEIKDFKINLDELKRIISKKTKLISLTHIFNTTGAKNDVEKIRNIVGNDVLVVIDGAQAIGHTRIDVKKIDCDFYVFGAHKALGPFGLGFLYMKNKWIEKINPFNFGGNMNITYSENNIEYAKGKKKFISGTQDLPSIIAFSKAINYIEDKGINEIENYINDLKQYAEKKFINEKINGKIINSNVKSSILFFEINNVPGEDVAYHLANENIIVRSGSSCVKIKNKFYKQSNVVRASFYIYNDYSDVDKLIESLKNGGDFLNAFFNKKPASKVCK